MVRPRGARSPLERRAQQVRPNYLSGQFGGITVAQWDEIRKLAGVEVAAPIANVGYILPTITIPVDLSQADPGTGRAVLRARLSWRTDRGLTRVPDAAAYVYVTDRPLQPEATRLPLTGSQEEVYRAASPEEQLPGGHQIPVCPSDDAYLYYANGPFSLRRRTTIDCFSRRTGLRGAGWEPFEPGQIGVQLQWPFPFLLSAIDPEQEAQLVGLDGAVAAGRYLRSGDAMREITVRNGSQRRIVPVLAADRSVVDEQAELAVEQLAPKAAAGLLRQHIPTDLLRFLDRQPAGNVVARHKVPVRVAYRRLLRALQAPPVSDRGPSVDQFWTVAPTVYREQSTTRTPRTVDRQLDVYASQSYNGDWVQVPAAARDTQFRVITAHQGDSSLGRSGLETFKLPNLHAVGVFDPDQLPGFDPRSALPLETYQPPALAAADTRSARLLGGRPLAPNGNLGGYPAQPPLLLTTLDAARVFASSAYEHGAGDALISAIRVRVAGVTGPDAISRERIRQVADRIARTTGLDVDVTVGTSPAPTRVTLPAGDFGRPALAVREPWVQKNVAATILTAVDRKSLILFVLILIVCTVFVTNAASAAVRARRTELGVLACLGWSTPRLFGVVLGEVGLIGLVAGLIGALFAVPIAAAAGIDTSIARSALAIPAATVLALLAGLVPAIRAARSDPIDAVRPAVLEARRAHSPASIHQLALLNLLRAPGRTTLGILSLTIGICALTLLLALSLAFREDTVGTLLGDAVSIQVRSTDYIAVAATLLLAAAAVADVLFLNLRERAGELATLTALGWDQPTIARLIILEGLWIGTAGATLGAALGLLGAAIFAGTLPTTLILTTLAAAAAGTLLAAPAALLPTLWLRRLPTIPLLASE